MYTCPRAAIRPATTTNLPPTAAHRESATHYSLQICAVLTVTGPVLPVRLPQSRARGPTPDLGLPPLLPRRQFLGRSSVVASPLLVQNIGTDTDRRILILTTCDHWPEPPEGSTNVGRPQQPACGDREQKCTAPGAPCTLGRSACPPSSLPACSSAPGWVRGGGG